VQKAHVTSVCSSVSYISEVCCKCVYMDVAKVDRNVAHVAMAIHVCCKMYVLNVSYVFRRVFASVPSVCCICFTHML
jgi:hypothetical protein